MLHGYNADDENGIRLKITLCSFQLKNLFSFLFFVKLGRVCCRLSTFTQNIVRKFPILIYCIIRDRVNVGSREYFRNLSG